MKNAQIKIKVDLDENKIPEKIFWTSDSGEKEKILEAKAMLLGFWDKNEKNALRLDLWTKSMMVNEMADFFYQTLIALSETYKRANNDSKLNQDILNFAEEFQKKFKAEQLNKNNN